MKLLILFGIVAYAAAVPLDDNCEWGESYWCSDLKVAKKCGALQHCMSTVWSKQILPKDGSEECLFCETVIAEVRKMLDDSQTVDKIQKMLMSVCDVIPDKTLEAKCKNVVQNDLPDLLSTISARLDPQLVCGLLGLCSGLEDKVQHPTHVPISSVAGYCPFKKFREAKGDANKVCTDCKTLLKDLRDTLTSKSTEKQVEKYLENYICASLGSLSDMCNKEVESYVPLVMSMLQAQIDPDMICEALCLCQSTTKSRALLATFRLQTSPLYNMVHEVDTTGACILCKTVFTELQTLDRDPATQKKVILVIKDKLCSRLGSMDAVCIVAVDKYANDIFELLVNELDPETRCSALGFCKEETNVISNASTLTRLAMPATPVIASKPRKTKASSTCVMCEFVIREIDSMLGDNATEAEIIQALDKVCGLMPDTIKAQCIQFVDEYGRAIIAMLEQQLDPKEVCTALGLCNSLVTSNKASKPLEKDEYCGVCEVVIQYLDSLLEDNKTVANIEKYLEIICNFLPKNYKKQCVDIIDKYGAGIIILLEEIADPKVICTKLGLCDDAVSNETVQMLELQPANYKTEQPLLGADKCTWGPSFWCDNMDNAKNCNAVEHCKTYVWKN
jgi:saposin